MHGGWPQAEIAIALYARSGKTESLSSARAEVEDYGLHGLYRTRSIFPLHQRFGGKFSEHRVAAFDLDTRNIAIGQHGRFGYNASFEVSIPEEIGVLRFDAYQNLAGILGRRLSNHVAGLDRQQQNHQRCQAKKVVDPGEVAKCAKREIHWATRRVGVERWRDASLPR